MDGQRKTRPSLDGHKAHHAKIAAQANHVLDEAKKLGSQIYGEGRERFDELQEGIKHRSDNIAHKVHERPLSSLLVAAGIGFVLARLLR